MVSHLDIKPGMEVYGADGERVGVVSDVEDDFFVQVIHVRGADAGDYTVPTTAIERVEGERVLLPNPAGMYLSQLHAHDHDAARAQALPGRTVSRRPHIHAAEYEAARAHFMEHFNQRERAAAGGEVARDFERAERHYRAGYRAARDERYGTHSTFEEAEPELRRAYEERRRDDGETWEELRARVREGWRHGRGA